MNKRRHPEDRAARMKINEEKEARKGRGRPSIPSEPSGLRDTDERDS